MNKFNLPQRSLLKDRRAKRSSLRRVKSGNSSLKLPAIRPQCPISGKKLRKQIKTRCQVHKALIESGLVSMQGIKTMAVDNSDGDKESQIEKKAYKVHIKKTAKLMLKTSKKQGKDAEDVMMQ